MKFPKPFGYRRFSLRTAMGGTARYRRLSQLTGLSYFLDKRRFVKTSEMNAKRRLGWYSPIVQLLRLGPPNLRGPLAMSGGQESPPSNPMTHKDDFPSPDPEMCGWRRTKDGQYVSAPRYDAMKGVTVLTLIVLVVLLSTC